MKLSLIFIVCGICLKWVIEVQAGLMHIPAPDVWKLFHLQCGKKCKYGYETDVEGNPFCKCRNPCKNVYCFGGTVCIIRREKKCNNGYCQLEAYCEEKSNVDNIPVDEFGNREVTESQNDKEQMSDLTLEDSFRKELNAAKMSSDTTQICSSGPPPDALSCAHPSRRYYYNDKKRKCVKFLGCESSGNNFNLRRDCQKTCRTTKTKPKHSRRESKKYKTDSATSKKTSNETNVCLAVSEEMTSCSGRKVVRWYFNSFKGRCERTKICKHAAKNFFRKRRKCRRACNPQKKGRGFKKRWLSRKRRINRRKFITKDFVR